MILLLFLYDPLYASSHDLESDYPWSDLKDENSQTSELDKRYFLLLSQIINRHAPFIIER